MPTKKKRINVSLPDHDGMVLVYLAKRDEVPVATKASELIRMAIELDEDAALNEIAEVRDVRGAKFFSHKDVWK